MEANPSNKDAEAINNRVLAIAVALLDFASPLNPPGHIRVLDLAFEAARVCMGTSAPPHTLTATDEAADTACLDCALKILKVAAKRLDSLEASVPAIDQAQLSALSAEYYMLRVHLAWQQGRPDIADHLFTKIPLKGATKDHYNVIGECICIGRGALEAGQYDAAIKWLEIALEELQENLDYQGLDSANFELQIRHTLACAYMKIGTPDAAEKLEGQIAVLKTKYGENPAVQVLELEIIRREKEPNSAEFFRVLKAIIEKLDWTEEYLNVVLGYIKYSMRLSIGLAFEMHHLLLKSLPCEKREWIEECFLRVPWMVSSTTDELDIPEEACKTAMNDALAFLEDRGIESISQEGTHVFFTILLNMLESPETSSCRHIAEKWCQLALDTKVFNDCFTSAKFNLQKRLATISFSNNDFVFAKQTLDQIVVENETKSDLQVQCLLFKLALHDEKDVYLEADRLNKSKAVIDCILEFMDLTTLLESSQDKSLVEEARSDPIRSRSTADIISFPLSMLSSAMEKKQGVSEENVLDLVYSVLKYTKQGFSKTDLSISIHELESICLDSYNLTLHIFNMFPLERSEEALQITKEIINLSRQRYESIQTETPQSVPSNSQEEKTEKQMSVQLGYIAYQFLFLEVSIRALCVRSEINSTSKFEHYTKIIKAIKSIREQESEYSEYHPLDIETLRNLSANEFEAAIALEDWSGIVTIIEDSESFFDAALFDHFMNCILTFEMADAYKAIFINAMVEIMRRAGSDMPILLNNFPSYYHHLFTFALAAANPETPTQLLDLSLHWPGEYHEMADSVIDEVLTATAEQSLPSGSGQQRVYPVEELGYLATSSFNQAMDFYSAENDQACLRWARKGILLAEAMRTPEGEELVCLFQTRLEGLF
ncbi:uncharacterized protein N7496_009145 [Penicillium cataractarum]|uniref:Protein ZIP4 homolog n=1 Tax=Penicillium cataractarum TaxID=2100454 RepID=A0A9W9UZM9_9EURO|nr:uncharacterized protein N7496_009145 [Penicillium cataractarum]KAJ5363432.1 hypothetical protein N7496_009145 [Penicillium cataractarum]